MKPPRFIAAATLYNILPPKALVETLRRAFREGEVVVPPRHHHSVAVPGAPEATLLLMPAWRPGGHMGVKVVSVFPGNSARTLPTVMGTYLLMDGETGLPLAVMDGTALTRARTAAASALAADYLAPRRAACLLMVGTGALAPHLIAAHTAIRPIERVLIWGRDVAKAQALAAGLNMPGIETVPVADLRGAVREADIISCATLSQEPLVLGAWLRAGQHLDLVGGFTPSMREADDAAVRAAHVFVDTLQGAMTEAGDLVQPLAAGVLSADDILGDLFDLCRGTHPGRRHESDLTLFKSVGTALEDIAAAQMAFAALGDSR